MQPLYTTFPLGGRILKILCLLLTLQNHVGCSKFPVCFSLDSALNCSGLCAFFQSHRVGQAFCVCLWAVGKSLHLSIGAHEELAMCRWSVLSIGYGHWPVWGICRQSISSGSWTSFLMESVKQLKRPKAFDDFWALVAMLPTSSNPSVVLLTSVSSLVGWEKVDMSAPSYMSGKLVTHCALTFPSERNYRLRLGVGGSLLALNCATFEEEWPG